MGHVMQQVGAFANNGGLLQCCGGCLQISVYDHMGPRGLSGVGWGQSVRNGQVGIVDKHEVFTAPNNSSS